MSIANEIARIKSAKSAIRRAINAKGGTLTDEKLDAYADAVDGLMPAEYGHRVRFIDFDGTVLKSMFVADGGSAAPPEVPAHPGLRFEHWNVPLSGITRDRDIGAVYTTESGAAEFEVRMAEKTGRSVTFSPCIESGTLTVEWGDGTVSTFRATGTQSASYTYAGYGDYTVKMKISAGGSWYLPARFAGNSSSNSILLAARIAGVGKVAESAFANCYALRFCTLDSGVTAVGDYAFNGCYALQSMTLPDSITALGNYAFSDCSTLRELVLPQGITEIPSSTARYCQALRSVVIPDGVTAIRAEAFSRCYSMASVSLPDGLLEIGSGAFQDNRALPEIRLPPTLTTLESYALSSCYSLKEVEIPDSVTELGTYCFSNSYALVRLKLPSGITQIPGELCQSCYALESIEIPPDVTRIGDDAFYCCYSLRKVVIPPSVNTIRNGAFRSCRAMMSVELYSETPPALGNYNAFYELSPACRIRVPKSADRAVLTAYKTASNWSTYADYFEEREEN